MEVEDVSSFKAGIQEETKWTKSKGTNDLRPRIWCNKQKMSFLVDSGAAVSIVPRSRVKGDVEVSQDVKLRAVNGSSIQTYGKRTFRLQFGRAHFTHTFIVADLPGVLGFDWMSQHGIHMTWTTDGKCKLGV